MVLVGDVANAIRKAFRDTFVLSIVLGVALLTASALSPPSFVTELYITFCSLVGSVTLVYTVLGEIKAWKSKSRG